MNLSMTTYTDPRSQAIYDAQAAAWENPTAMIKSVLGQPHPPGYLGILDDPEDDGFAVFPEHDYQDSSSPILFIKSMNWNKLGGFFKRDLEIYLYDDMTFKAQTFFLIDHAVVMVGELICEGEQAA